MYGYATDETPERMPLTIQLAHGLNRRMAECRRNGTLPWIRPDSKSQVIYKLNFVPIINEIGTSLSESQIWLYDIMLSVHATCNDTSTPVLLAILIAVVLL